MEIWLLIITWNPDILQFVCTNVLTPLMLWHTHPHGHTQQTEQLDEFLDIVLQKEKQKEERHVKNMKQKARLLRQAWLWPLTSPGNSVCRAQAHETADQPLYFGESFSTGPKHTHLNDHQCGVAHKTPSQSSLFVGFHSKQEEHMWFQSFNQSVSVLNNWSFCPCFVATKACSHTGPLRIRLDIPGLKAFHLIH